MHEQTVTAEAALGSATKMCGASTKRVAQHHRDHTERSEEYALKAQNLLNHDGGRLKLGSLASTRCTGLVAKYTVALSPLTLNRPLGRLFNHQQEYTSQPPARLSARCTSCPISLSCLLDASRSHPRRLSAPKHLAEQLFSFCCSRPSRTSAEAKIKFVF
jgi:hypothetical protein